jgi:hypothetical protein
LEGEDPVRVGARGDVGQPAQFRFRVGVGRARLPLAEGGRRAPKIGRPGRRLDPGEVGVDVGPPLVAVGGADRVQQERAGRSGERPVAGRDGGFDMAKLDPTPPLKV